MADRSVTIRLGMNPAGLVAGARTATKSLQGIGSRGLDWVGRNQQSISQLSTTVGALGLVAVGTAGAAVKAAIDWESAWAGVIKTVDGTDEQLATLEEDLRGLAQTLPATHEEIAGVAEAAGQLGVGVEDVAEFTETMIQLGETTNLTADEAATALARVSNIMGTATSDVDRMGATIVELGNNSATTEAEIVELSTRLAAAGRQAGLTESDIFAIASTLTSVGVPAEAAGTAMSKVFTSIGNAVRDGNDDLATFAKVAGTTTDEFVRAFEEDAAGAIGMFVEGMGDMAKSGESTSGVFEELGLTDARLTRTIMSAGSATGMWAEQLELANDAWVENTALSEEAAKRFETPAAKMQIAWNNIKDAAIDFGAAALPAVAGLADGVANVAQKFGNLPAPVQTATTAIVGGGGLVALGLAGLGKLVVGIANTRDALTNLGAAGRRIGRSMRFAGVAGAVGAVAFGIMELNKELNQTEISSQDAYEGLLALRRGEQTAAIDELIDAQVRLQDSAPDPGVWGSLKQGLQNLSGSGAPMLELQGASEEFSSGLAQIDAELAKLAAQDLEGAKTSFEALAEALGYQGEEVDRLLNNLPAYQEMLRGTEEDQAAAAAAAAETGDAQEGMAGDVDEATGEIEDQTSALVDLVEQLQAAGMLALSARDAERNLEAAIDDATASLEENGTTLDITTEKGRANQSALDDIASSTHDLIGAMAEQGASEEDLQGVMQDSRDEFIDTATQMGLTKDEAKDLADQLGLIPGDYEANIEAEDNASGEIDNVRDKLEGLDGLKSTVYISEILQQRTLPPSGIRLPGNARGTDDWRGGLTWVGEEGPELVNLPRGSQVFPADESRQMTAGASSDFTASGASGASSFARYLDLLQRGLVQLGDVTEAEWDVLQELGWRGKAGDRMEALYPPLEGVEREYIRLGEVTDQEWRRLMRLGWSGRAGDDMEALYPPLGKLRDAIEREADGWSGGPGGGATGLSGIRKAAAELLDHVRSGGSFFEDFTYHGSSDLLGRLNEELIEMYYDQLGGSFNRGDIVDFLKDLVGGTASTSSMVPFASSSQASSTASPTPDEFTATATLDLGEGIKQVVDIKLQRHDRGLKRRAKQGTGAAR